MQLAIICKLILRYRRWIKRRFQILQQEVRILLHIFSFIDLRKVKPIFTAMENWGLVTYREPYLLYNETIHSDKRKLGVVTTIAHEFGHQWFGDLVGPEWWNFLWLNEGFATLFQNIGTDLVRLSSHISNEK